MQLDAAHFPVVCSMVTGHPNGPIDINMFRDTCAWGGFFILSDPGSDSFAEQAKSLTDK